MGWRKVKEIRLVLVIFSNFGNWIYAVFHINFSFGLGPEPQSYLLRNDKREFQAQQNVFFLSTQHPFFWHYSYVLFTTEIFYLIEMVWVSTQQRTNDHISPLTNEIQSHDCYTQGRNNKAGTAWSHQVESEKELEESRNKVLRTLPEPLCLPMAELDFCLRQFVFKSCFLNNIDFILKG